jgi:hypothetical protein
VQISENIRKRNEVENKAEKDKIEKYSEPVNLKKNFL